MKEGVAQGCRQCPEEVRQELQNVKRPLQVGLRLEDLPSVLERPSIRHSNGAREARRAQQF